MKVLIVNKQRRTTAYPISTPRAFGPVDIKSTKSVHAYIINISIKS